MKAGEIKLRFDDLLYLAYNFSQRLLFLARPLEETKTLAENRFLKGCHTGRRCFIIGNGPSIKHQDLSLLNSEYTFVVNKFIRHEQAERIDPNFYVIVDAKMEKGRWGTAFLSKIDQRLPDVRMFTTLGGKRYFDEQHLFSRHSVRCLDPSYLFHMGFPFGIDIARVMPCTTNVIKTSLFLAVYMGFNPIYLVGVDGDGLVRSGDTHFYGSEPQFTTQDQYERDLTSMAVGLRGWRAIAKYLGDRGVSVYYANPEGIIESFPRVDYERVVGLADGPGSAARRS